MKLKILTFSLILILLLSGCAGPVPGSDDENPPPVTDQDDLQKDAPELDGDCVKIRFFTVEGIENWGDCTYIEFPNGENMMIDTGLSSAAQIIADDLLDQGIDHIDHLVLSHSHNDHVDGVTDILTYMSVKHAYSADYFTTEYQSIIRDLKNQGADHTTIRAGSSFDVGDVHFDVLWPSDERCSGELTQTSASSSAGNCSVEYQNGCSVLMKMTYGETSALFTGDLYTSHDAMVMKYLGDNVAVLDSDVLKIPHHGYNNASSPVFIKAISPTYAVSMGTHVMNSTTYKAYTDANCTCYFSWMNGNVYVYMNGTDVLAVPDNDTVSDYYQ